MCHDKHSTTSERQNPINSDRHYTRAKSAIHTKHLLTMVNL